MKFLEFFENREQNKIPDMARIFCLKILERKLLIQNEL